MAQSLYSINNNPSFGKIIEIDLANSLILAEKEGHEEGHHHESHEGKAEEKEGHEGKKEGHEGKEEGHEGKKEGHEGKKEGHEGKEEGHEEKEGEEEVPAFVPTTDFSAEYIIYFGSGLLSLAVLAVVIIWIRGTSGSNE